jgi:hypothetical protein
MLDFLQTLSDKQLFAFLSSLFVAISLLTVIMVQRFIPNKLRRSHNAVIGNVSSLIGLIYGVLAGLTALYLINNLSYTGDAVQKEANAVANLYRDSTWLKEPVRTQVKNELSSYVNKVITVEWPLMKDGAKISEDAGTHIENVSHELNSYNSFNNSEMLILHDMLDEIKALYNARETRIEMSYASLNSDLWAVILIGTLLMISINFLFGMNFYFHMVTSIAAALMAASMIFLLLTLDKPFQGDFVIEPDALQQILNSMHHAPLPQAEVVKPVTP